MITKEINHLLGKQGDACLLLRHEISYKILSTRTSSASVRKSLRRFSMTDAGHQEDNLPDSCIHAVVLRVREKQCPITDKELMYECT